MMSFFSKRKGDFHVAKEIPRAVYIKPEEVRRSQNLPKDDEVVEIFGEIKKVYCALFRYAEMCANIYSNGLSAYGESGKMIWEELQEVDEYIKKAVNSWMSSYGITHDKSGNVQDYDKFTYSPISQAKLGEFETRILPELKKMGLDTAAEWDEISESEDGSPERYEGCKITPSEALRFFKYVANCSLNGIYPVAVRDDDGYLHAKPGYNVDSLAYQAKHMIKQTLPGNTFTNVKIGNSLQVQSLDFYLSGQGTKTDYDIVIALCDWDGDPIPETESVIPMDFTQKDILEATNKIVFYETQKETQKEEDQYWEFEDEEDYNISINDVVFDDSFCS